MKTLILVLHMVSGSILTVTNPSEVKAIKSCLTSYTVDKSFTWGSWLGCYRGITECYCTIDGKKMHINTSMIEYIEEEWMGRDK